MACWSTKAAISLKRVKIEEKLLWRTYRKSPTLFRTVPTPTPLRPPLLHNWGFATSKTDKATASNLTVHSQGTSECPLKILDKRERRRIQGLSNFLVPPIISGRGKATNFKFCEHIHRIDRNKSPLKIWGKVAVGVLRLSKIFRAP